jgi:putative selenate reductase molybdopterin-binding subunit
VTYAEISRFTVSGTGIGQLTSSACYTTDKAAFPYGAHYCQVAVNTRTGAVKVQKYYALQDCGTPINPELALGQMYGGVLKTIGHSLFEEMLLDGRGRCLNANLLDYKVPMIHDLPDEFRALLIETNDPFGPFGGKSVSEIACNGAAPALAAAIHDATGVWLRSWPFTAEKILRGLGRITDAGDP